MLLAVVVATLPAVAVAKSFEPEPFVPKPNEPIKTIGLIQVPEPARYYLGEGSFKAWQPAFLPPLLSVLIEQTQKHEEYEIIGFSFPPVAQPRLISHLEAAGFKVIVIPVEREKPRLLESYDSLPTTGIDAYLDVAPSGVGYQGTYGFKVYRQKGTNKTKHLDKLTRKLFAQCLAWRPQVTQTKAE